MKNRRLTFTGDAKNDILDAIIKLEKRKTHLSDGLQSEIFEKVAQVESLAKEIDKSENDKIFYLSLDDYPYSMVYLVNRSFIRIFAFLEKEQISDKIKGALLKRKSNSSKKKENN